MLAVTPEKQKTFEEVKAEVKAAAIEQERRKEIAALAAKLVDRLGKGETHRRASPRRSAAKVREDHRPSPATPRRRA